MKKQVLTKRERKPTKYDALSVFGAWGQDERIAITQKGAIAKFARFLEQSLKESLASDTMLYGNRTQLLFEAMVANLGAVQLVKSEDAGDVYSLDPLLEIPDTRVVLADGRNILVETKNRHATPTKPYRMKADYLDGLARYAKLVGCELRIAIFWSHGQKWTLVPASAFKPDGKFVQIGLGDAFMSNDMGLLGDKLIGCRFPVTIRAFVEKKAGKSHTRLDRYRYFIHYREITTEREKRLLFFLMIWGEWEMDRSEVIEEDDYKRVVDAVFMPSMEARGEGVEGAGCVLNAFLSTVLSRYWLQVTSNGTGKIQTLLPNREHWSTRMLELTEESSRLFAICTVVSNTTGETTALQ